MGVEQITENTKEWLRRLAVGFPVDVSKIDGFKAWVNISGFGAVDPKYENLHHDGYDFGAYLRRYSDEVRGVVAVGFLGEVPIYAVASGVVEDSSHISGVDFQEHYSGVDIRHSGRLWSRYLHVIPEVERGAEVRRGQRIGHLHRDKIIEEDGNNWTHLHLSLFEGGRVVDPGKVLPGLYRLNAEPQESARFRVVELPGVKVELVDFRKIRLNGTVSE